MRALLIVVSGVLLGSACGYADPISQSRNGGVLALTGDEQTAMDEAEKLMRAHCGPENFRIERIEEVVVDEEDYVIDEVVEGEDGEYAETRAGTEEILETHVTYRCIVPASPHR